jgi:DNA repair protein RecO (recombination protein O)
VFEYRLLSAAGFGLQLEREAGGDRPVEPGARYLYVPERGPVRRDTAAGDGEVLVSGAALLALKSGTPEAEQLPELKALMRGLIRHHLGDRAISSLQLFL